MSSSGGGGPDEGSVGAGLLDVPAGAVLEAVVGAAQVGEVGGVGGAAVDVGVGVVEVGPVGGGDCCTNG